MIYRPRRPRWTIFAFNNVNALLISVVPLVVGAPLSVFAALYLPTGGFTAWRSFTMCLKVDEHGLVIRNFWNTVEMLWDDVTAIEARRVFGSSDSDLCLWFVRRSGKPVRATITMYPSHAGQSLIDALKHIRKAGHVHMPFKAPTSPRWFKKGSDSWQVVDS